MPTGSANPRTRILVMFVNIPKWNIPPGSGALRSQVCCLWLLRASPVAQQRALGGIVGCYAANAAATMALRWICNTGSVAKKVRAGGIQDSIHSPLACSIATYTN